MTVQPPLAPLVGGKYGKCIDYLSLAGTTFEKTEHPILNWIAGKAALRVPILWKPANFLREEYVCLRINTTLRDGERGLLLFGGSHEETLVPKLKTLDLKLEVYS